MCASLHAVTLHDSDKASGTDAVQAMSGHGGDRGGRPQRPMMPHPRHVSRVAHGILMVLLAGCSWRQSCQCVS